MIRSLIIVTVISISGHHHFFSRPGPGLPVRIGSHELRSNSPMHFHILPGHWHLIACGKTERIVVHYRRTERIRVRCAIR